MGLKASTLADSAHTRADAAPKPRDLRRFDGTTAPCHADFVDDPALAYHMCVAGARAARAQEDWLGAWAFVRADGGTSWPQCEREAAVLAAERTTLAQAADAAMGVALRQGQWGAVRDAGVVAGMLNGREETMLAWCHHVQGRVAGVAERLYARLTQGAGNTNVDFQILDESGEARETERTSCSDALTDLFELVAGMVEDQKTVFDVDAMFGPGAERYVIGHLQAQADQWASKIYSYFMEQIDLAAILAQIHAQDEQLDPRDLTDLLEELALLSRCTEFYHRFVQDKATKAAEAMDEASQLEPVMDREHAGEKLVFSANAYLQEIRSYYVAFEEYFLQESVTRAIQVGREEADATQTERFAMEVIPVSPVIEYVFFVLQHSTRRVLLTASAKNVCHVMYLLNNALQLEFKTCLDDAWQDGIRQYRRLTALGNDAAQFWAASVSVVNDMDASSEYIKQLGAQVAEQAKEVFAAGRLTAAEQERLNVCISDLKATAQSYEALATQSVGTLFACVEPAVAELVHAFSVEHGGAVDAQGHVQQADMYKISMASLDTAMGSSIVSSVLLRGISDIVFGAGARGLSPRNRDTLCVRVATYLNEWWLDRALSQSFTLAGGLLFSRQVSKCVQELCVQCTTHSKSLAVSAAFARAQGAAQVLECTRAAEVLEYFQEGLVQLDVASVVSLLDRREDFVDNPKVIQRRLSAQADNPSLAPPSTPQKKSVFDEEIVERDESASDGSYASALASLSWTTPQHARFKNADIAPSSAPSTGSTVSTRSMGLTEKPPIGEPSITPVKLTFDDEPKERHVQHEHWSM